MSYDGAADPAFVRILVIFAVSFHLFEFFAI